MSRYAMCSLQPTLVSLRQNYTAVLQLTTLQITIGVNSWVIHRDSDIFAPDPTTFRPERWIETSPERLELMEKAYIPFGLGTRTCVGKNILMLEMTKLIPELVRRYRFEVLSREMQSTNWFAKQKDVMVKV
ncbi:hypothetical protein OIDMADRAFT_36363 [Oidiodendron maius Zn]|uniref:Cytochrome P450 n=1 Tax=Oidiodendron maius (strain Zn) TaxID=913774 RepID=A0A0C3C1L5_OIDMZ|nr:hypothetical protein OIDMADRAFT_36363 [Oidiodendron maius Zn]